MRRKLQLSILMIMLGLLWATGAFAVPGAPTPNAGFDMTGFIQEATVAQVGTVAVDPHLRGGTLTINGIQMIVPDNSIVQMPAAAFTWADLFLPANSLAIGNYTPPRRNHANTILGLALDGPAALHYPSYEVRVVGNIITTPATGTQQYIVGLIIPAAQQGLNAASGYINYIDYDGTALGGIPGRFRVGGTMGDPTTGTLCELNDPFGRFGAAHSPDPRFQVDWNNPTVTTATGYPVGIPTVKPDFRPNGVFPLPNRLGDPDRPTYNRPINGSAFGTDPFMPVNAPLKAFTMPAAVAPNGAGVTTPDPWKQVPLFVGDWVDFSGTLLKIDPLGPSTAANSFMSVHSLTAHLGIKTAPGTDPAYVRVEEFVFGVGDATGVGPTVAGIAQETSNKAVLVSFTTDSNPALLKGNPGLAGGALFGIDVNPTTGVESELQFPNGSTQLSSPATFKDSFDIDDPIRGRMRWQVNKNATPPDSKTFVSNAVGPRKFFREYILRLTYQSNFTINRSVQLPDQANGLPGLIAGQYRFPIFDYIFGEGTQFGQPVPPFNFNDFGFLHDGSGLLNGTTGPVIGPLNPFPVFN